jgi:ribonuclease-3
MSRLEDVLGHTFADGSLLEAALIHPSYTAEHPETPHFERLEFLGDAVLQLVVTDFLYATYPYLNEGQMAKVRAWAVNRDELAAVARGIDLGPEIRLGRGEEASGGREKDSILADAMEAVIGAVYLDSGFELAREIVLAHWTDRIRTRARRPGLADYKTRLQEILAAAGTRPEYQVEGTGPDHARFFNALVLIDGRVRGEGGGRSKKEAEQEAARRALESLLG